MMSWPTMKVAVIQAVAFAMVGSLFVILGPDVRARSHPQPERPMLEDTIIEATATGTFDVELTPLEREDGTDGAGLDAMSIEKRFHGDLEGTSRGEMLSSRDEAAGWAVYVALERVTAALDGRSGSFLFTHRGVMVGDDGELTVTVVPGTATGELEGLAGDMSISIDEGTHSYEFEYTLPASGG